MRIKQQIAHWEEKQREVVQVKISPEMQAEIRQWMKLQNMEAIRAAVNGDIRACSAVLSGPNFLSGLDERQMDIIKLTAHEKWAPEQTASLRESQRCLQQVEKAGSRFAQDIGICLKIWETPPSAALAELEAES